jgi:hypothetical protein
VVLRVEKESKKEGKRDQVGGAKCLSIAVRSMEWVRRDFGSSRQVAMKKWFEGSWLGVRNARLGASEPRIGQMRSIPGSRWRNLGLELARLEKYGMAFKTKLGGFLRHDKHRDSVHLVFVIPKIQ